MAEIGGGAVPAEIVRAAIHPAIGVARIGDAATAYYIGPEVTTPQPEEPGFYRDEAGALKRQAARFRIYGLDAEGRVVRELTAADADITWTVHPVNRKAAWYQFQAALDIPEAATMAVPRRNPDVPFAQRGILVIDPGPRSISGADVSGGADHAFDTGKFKDTVVPLGEIRTDDAGRLLFLGGRGASASPSGAPVYRPEDPNSFNNADDWYDDTSDGPVTAAVVLDGRPLPVEPAWVVVAPPNYAPDVISWRTLHDLLTDTYIESGRLPMPDIASFARDIQPVLERLTGLQWVNKGFAGLFGAGGPMDFTDPALIDRLATPPAGGEDPWMELRRNIYNAFRAPHTIACEPSVWPWLYGDAYGSFQSDDPNNYLPMSATRAALMEMWVEGRFTDDRPSGPPPQVIDQVPLEDQPAMLDKAALHFCIADAFHPGCEVTWPMRHGSMYQAPYRLRHRPAGQPEQDYGKELTQAVALSPGGPVYAQAPGDVTRWMALPWQGDTAFCRSGYDAAYDPYLPSFWPARVPNQVLTVEDYQTVMNEDLPHGQRVAAFQRRASWMRGFTGSVADVMDQMIARFGAQGIVEARPGVQDDPDLPPVIFVESRGAALMKAAFAAAAPAMGPDSDARRAGWESEAQMEEFRSIRVRHTDRRR
ncbi:LodA/GoxA family CTQ-dependent oxidase [Tistrella mobilis]|uniref:LodA/GoxA family CTQ-dependent oxidase n=1 Tax=Tistrella mobilis TaxID=171437 RepID=UPI0035565DBD